MLLFHFLLLYKLYMDCYLFYSKNCNYCITLLNLIYENKFDKHINLINIDEISTSELTQRGLRFVPTFIIIINDQQYIHEKESAFRWLTNMINHYKHKNDDNSYSVDFNKFSDSYAYWADDISKDKNEAFPNLFSSINLDNSHIDIIPENKTIKKIDKSSQKQLLINLTNLRNQQDLEFKKLLKIS